MASDPNFSNKRICGIANYSKTYQKFTITLADGSTRTLSTGTGNAYWIGRIIKFSQ